jgi:hypothetical protein
MAIAPKNPPDADTVPFPAGEPWMDDVLGDLYAARDAYAAEHGYDLNRIFADLKRREQSSELRRATETD